MAYKELAYGASGDDVKQLQRKLNGYGYQLDTDGMFGDATQSALRDYQSKSGLAVDGIAGANTWEKLNETNTAAGVNSGAKNTAGAGAASPAQSGYTAPAQQFQNPGEMPDYSAQISAAYDAIVNQKPFSYDMNADALYQQYKDQYVSAGQMAMRDTMGQAAGLTGGYGSSYGQNVGQQAYQAYLQKLNDIIPQLEERAYGRYQDEENARKEKYAMLQNLEDREIAKWQNAMNLYLQEQADLYRKEQDARTWDYQLSRDAMSDEWMQKEWERQLGLDEYQKEQDAKSWEYQLGRDAVSDEWAQKEWDYAVEQANKGAVPVFDQATFDNYMSLYEKTGEKEYLEIANAMLAQWMGIKGEDETAEEDLIASGALLGAVSPLVNATQTGDAGTGNEENTEEDTGSGDIPTNYGGIEQAVKDGLAKGRSKEYTLELIQTAVAAGYVSEAQGQLLIDKYLVRHGETGGTGVGGPRVPAAQIIK